MLKRSEPAVGTDCCHHPAPVRARQRVPRGGPLPRRRCWRGRTPCCRVECPSPALLRCLPPACLQGEAAHLDKVERRYAYIKAKVKAREEAWAVFPPSWRVPQLITLALCKITRTQVMEMLDAQDHDVRHPARRPAAALPTHCPPPRSCRSSPCCPCDSYSPVVGYPFTGGLSLLRWALPSPVGPPFSGGLSLLSSQVPAVLAGLHRTLDFERELDERFGAARGAARDEDEEAAEAGEGGPAADSSESAAQLRKKYELQRRRKEIEVLATPACSP